MSISVRCAACNKLYKVDDALAGRKVRCKACGAALAIPAAAPNPAAAMTNVSDYAVGRAYGTATGVLFWMTVLLSIGPALLCLLGVFIASRIMRFANRPRLWWKCLGAVTVPWALSFAYNRFSVND